MSSDLPIARPPEFTYRRGGVLRKSLPELHADRISLSRLAERHGTPLYVYSAAAIRRRYQTFDTAFGHTPHTICYSVKANSNLGLLKVLARLGSGFDVVSGGELERVLRAHKPSAKQVVFSGVGKTAAEMDFALRADIVMFNVESEAEIHLLAERAGRLRKRARVALRVNPDVNAETHPYIATGLREHKFGVAITEADRIYLAAKAERWLDLAGVSVHIGSQITSSEPFAEAMERVAALVRRLRSAGVDIRYVDAGGGLGIQYQPSDKQIVADTINVAATYAQALLGPLRALKVHLLLEPGRFIVGPAGVLLTRVLYVKQNGNKQFVVMDAAMNDLIRPSLYGAYHEIVPVVWDAAAPQDKTYDVVGPICETGDFFARDRQLPELHPGELIALLDVGAYGMALASNYNTRPRAAEVLVDEKSAHVIRRRETLNDLLRAEKL